ncbi:E3 ubiquitin-protein ligase At3g02290-like isoform X1 [Triticum urartu]|uniref:E3 ubiquitin-protein ligase At3g02290-like isoform X1 n=1 Tax=Triticum urartu TaxID=4572 RepID=UPI0020438E23|nr:E3 ubiquitin-protein ligase At3g02290-like isoform X1 [Triticum urartu]
MGAFCSCLQADYSDRHGNQTSGAFRNCMCLRCFTQQLINAYTVLFRVGTVHSVSQAIEATPLDSSESSFDTYRSPPRPLPYDDPRFSPPLRDWFASRQDPSSHSPEESEPLRPNHDEEIETMSSVDKPSKTNYDTKMKRSSSAYGDKLSRKESGNYFTYFSPSTEDEDVCPTCLEDYTSENPRIVMQCSHHFHLGCIYEWMERSEACPVCGKVPHVEPESSCIATTLILGSAIS